MYNLAVKARNSVKHPKFWLTATQLLLTDFLAITWWFDELNSMLNRTKLLKNWWILKEILKKFLSYNLTLNLRITIKNWQLYDAKATKKSLNCNSLSVKQIYETIGKGIMIKLKFKKSPKIHAATRRNCLLYNLALFVKIFLKRNSLLNTKDVSKSWVKYEARKKMLRDWRTP